MPGDPERVAALQIACLPDSLLSLLGERYVAVDFCLQTFAVEEFHDNAEGRIVRLDVVNFDDVRMVEFGDN